MCYFGGLSIEEIVVVFGIFLVIVKCEWVMVWVWLLCEMVWLVLCGVVRDVVFV